MQDKVRRAHTEALFRNVNERIAESAERFEAESTEFVCECADANCAHRIEATLEEYEEVRADGTTFILAPATRTPTSSAWSRTASASTSLKRCTRPFPRR
jgi:hypothetical protein